MQILQLLADLTALEVAVLKLEEKSSTLRSQLQQAHAETEIAESQKQGVEAVAPSGFPVNYYQPCHAENLSYPTLRQEPESQEPQNKCKVCLWNSFSFCAIHYHELQSFC